MMILPNVLIYSSNSIYVKKDCGGAERSLSLIAENLVKNGINTVYFTNANSTVPIIKKKIINNVEVVLFSPWRPGPLWNKLFPPHLLTVNKQAALSELIRSKNINIVHTYDVVMDTLELIKLREKYNLNFKIVLRMAGLYWVTQLASGYIDSKTIEYIFNHVDLINFLDIGFKSLFHEKCSEFGITVTNPNSVIQDIGIDLKKYCPRSKLIENKKFTILSTARFSAYAKRQDLLIKALDLLRKEDIVIEFAGHGELLDVYRREIDRLSLTDKVKFHGHLPADALSKVTKKADLFVLPTDWEGVNKSVLETMAMKIPTLVSDVKPLNSYLCHNKTAFLTENKAEKWAEMILTLKNNPQLLMKVATQGHDYVMKKYGADRNIHQYINSFKTCLNKRF